MRRRPPRDPLRDSRVPELDPNLEFLSEQDQGSEHATHFAAYRLIRRLLRRKQG